MKEYLFEMHMHTSETSPCGKVPARNAVRLYYELGYDGVCITDHFFNGFFERLGDLPWKSKIDAYLTGYRTAKDEGEKLGIRVILGMEYCLSSTMDDILIYGFDEEFLYNNENLHLLNEHELKAIAEANNLLLIQAHPFRKMIPKTYDNLVDGFEVYNGHPRHDSRNELAEKHALMTGGIMISGSDFHRAEDAGTGGVYLPRLPYDSHDLAKIIREVKTPRIVRNDREKHGKQAELLGR